MEACILSHGIVQVGNPSRIHLYHEGMCAKAKLIPPNLDQSDGETPHYERDLAIFSLLRDQRCKSVTDMTMAACHQHKEYASSVCSLTMMVADREDG